MVLFGFEFGGAVHQCQVPMAGLGKAQELGWIGLDRGGRRCRGLRIEGYAAGESGGEFGGCLGVGSGWLLTADGSE